MGGSESKVKIINQRIVYKYDRLNIDELDQTFDRVFPLVKDAEVLRCEFLLKWNLFSRLSGAVATVNPTFETGLQGMLWKLASSLNGNLSTVEILENEPFIILRQDLNDEDKRLASSFQDLCRYYATNKENIYRLEADLHKYKNDVHRFLTDSETMLSDKYNVRPIEVFAYTRKLHANSKKVHFAFDVVHQIRAAFEDIGKVLNRYANSFRLTDNIRKYEEIGIEANKKKYVNPCRIVWKFSKDPKLATYEDHTDIIQDDLKAEKEARFILEELIPKGFTNMSRAYVTENNVVLEKKEGGRLPTGQTTLSAMRKETEASQNKYEENIPMVTQEINGERDIDRGEDTYTKYVKDVAYVKRVPDVETQLKPQMKSRDYIDEVEEINMQNIPSIKTKEVEYIDRGEEINIVKKPSIQREYMERNGENYNIRYGKDYENIERSEENLPKRQGIKTEYDTIERRDENLPKRQVIKKEYDTIERRDENLPKREVVREYETTERRGENILKGQVLKEPLVVKKEYIASDRDLKPSNYAEREMSYQLRDKNMLNVDEEVRANELKNYTISNQNLQTQTENIITQPKVQIFGQNYSQSQMLENADNKMRSSYSQHEIMQDQNNQRESQKENITYQRRQADIPKSTDFENMQREILALRKKNEELQNKLTQSSVFIPTEQNIQYNVQKSQDQFRGESLQNLQDKEQREFSDRYESKNDLAKTTKLEAPSELINKDYNYNYNYNKNKDLNEQKRAEECNECEIISERKPEFFSQVQKQIQTQFQTQNLVPMSSENQNLVSMSSENQFKGESNKFPIFVRQHIGLKNTNFILKKTINSSENQSIKFIESAIDLDYIITGLRNGKVTFWRFVNFHNITEHKTITISGAPIKSMLYLNDGKTLLIGSKDGKLVKCDLTTFACSTICELNSPIASLANPLNGYSILLASGNKIYEIDMFKKSILFTLEAHSGLVTDLVFNQQKQIFCTSGLDKCVKVWNNTTKECLGILQGHNDIIKCICFAYSKEHLLLCSVAKDSFITFWNLSDKNLTRSIKMTSPAIKVMYLWDKKHVMSIHNNGTFNLWNLENEELKEYGLNKANYTGGAYFDDGRNVIISTKEGALEFWNAK